MNTSIIYRVIITLIIYINVKGDNIRVSANPLNGLENGQLLTRIYNDERWNANRNGEELEYRPRHQNSPAWITEMNNDKKQDINEDCKYRRTCGSGSSSADVTMVEVPIKKEMFVSRGWGAGGMPFNILYMKNPKPNKSLRSSSLLMAEPIRSQPISQAQQQFTPNGFDGVHNTVNDKTLTGGGEEVKEIIQTSNGSISNGNNRPKGRSANAMLVPSRRHYSIIPQLFVSYGWGPIGK